MHTRVVKQVNSRVKAICARTAHLARADRARLATPNFAFLSKKNMILWKIAGFSLDKCKTPGIILEDE